MGRHMFDESMTDRQFLGLGERRQREALAEHCAQIEKRIRIAPSRLEAEDAAQQACDRFARDCPSSIVRKALARRIWELVEQRWETRP
jgi:hypothetical protein